MTAGTVVITGGILATVILLCIIAVLCYCRLQYYCCKREDLDSEDEEPELSARPPSPDSRCSELATADGKCNHLPVGPPPCAASCRHQWPPHGDCDPQLLAAAGAPRPERLDYERRTCCAAGQPPYCSPFYVHVSLADNVRNGGERVAYSPPQQQQQQQQQQLGFPVKRAGHFGGFSQSVSTEV